MKKSIFITLIAIAAATSASAQFYPDGRPIHPKNRAAYYDSHPRHHQPVTDTYGGVRGGVSLSTVNSDSPYLDGNRTKAGVNVGLAVGTSLSSYSPVYLESGLYFVQKGGESKHGGEKFTYGLDYLEIPLVFKYKAPVGGDVTIEPFLGGFVSCGVSGEIKDFQHRQAYSSFSDDYNDNFRRFDGGLRIGCGLLVDMFYIEAGYDLGLANVGKDYFDDTHTGALNLSVGINF